ncbi:MAG: hypothetical protein JKY95_08975, partial [Planctomycetaceae bacterium]|nr:hypothetical protein [Planctomycetaceae bacterium]
SASTTSNSSDEDTKTRIQADEVKIPFYKKYNPIRKTQKLLTPKPNGELVFPDAPPEQ